MDNKTGFDFFVSLLSMAIGILGGLVKYLNEPNVFSWKGLFTRLITSGFTGLIVGWILSVSDISQPIQWALIAISGVGGASILDALVDALRNKLNSTIKKDN